MSNRPMRPVRVILVFAVFMLLSATPGIAQETARPAAKGAETRSAPAAQPSSQPAAQAAIRHRFACTDYTGGKVFIVDADGKIEWEYPAATCNDIWARPNGNLLFNDGKSAKEVSRDKKVAWSYEGKANIYACQRLANGNTFVAECETGRLLEIDPAGKVAREVRLLPEGKTGGSDYMRNARRLENGHYLVAHYGAEIVREYDDTGKEVWSAPAKGGPHSVVRLPNGNTLIACADKGRAARVVEVDDKGKTVWEIEGDELSGISLKFMGGLERLANGNTVITNWQGHGKLGQTQDIAEVTPDKKVVWTFSDHVHMKTVSSIILLDAEGRH
jgi:outer membrane protein assembly factor BamB